jgi:hypothetical protein
MAVSIIDSLTTITEVCLLQAHNMNSLADAAGTRIFSDDMISTIINNVIRFVYANSYKDLLSEAELNAVNTLSVIALNNVMFEAGYLPEWKWQDPFDKMRFITMIETIKEDDDDIDVIPMYRSHWDSSLG